jgi:hypothetical protein
MRSVVKLSALAVWLLLAGIAAGCGESPVSPGPSNRPSPPAPPPVVPGPAIASLAIEDPFVILRPTQGSDAFGIEVRFLLRETGGSSGATIRSIFLGDGRGGGDTIGGFCTDGVRVPPGGVLDTYYTDEGYESLSYCAPYAGLHGAPTLNRPIYLTVYFADDDGRHGSADAMAVSK